MGRRRAFTLVELLVVIGIIAILIGILLPTLSRARESGKTAQCLSNLRTIGQAVHTYASEQRQWLVPAYIDPPGDGGPGAESWATILVNAKYLPAPKQIGMDNLAQESTTNASNSVFFCPNGTNLKHDVNNKSGPDDPVPQNPEDPVNQWFWRRKSNSTGIQIDHWYAANGSDGWDSPNSQDNWPMRSLKLRNSGKIDGGPLTRITDIKKSSETALILDGLRLIDGRPGRISARHNGRKIVNFLMADGHCESIHSKSLPRMEGQFNPMSGNDGWKTLSQRYPHPKWRMEQQR